MATQRRTEALDKTKEVFRSNAMVLSRRPTCNISAPFLSFGALNPEFEVIKMAFSTNWIDEAARMVLESRKQNERKEQCRRQPSHAAGTLFLRHGCRNMTV
jgi:hypothetical protein